MTRSPFEWPRIATGIAAALLVPAAIAAPAAPAAVRAIPDYADSSIIVRWDDVTGEDGYRVFRAEVSTGPFQQVGPDLSPDTTSFTDAGLLSSLEYFYRVRSFDIDGESIDSNTFQQNVKTVWPNPGNFALLHNWNDTLGAAGSGGQGYHKGCDVQQTGPTQNTLVFPRGGIIARVGSGGRDNNHAYVEVKIGGTLRYDSFNHLDGNNASALGYDVGDYVRAGQTLGKIADKYFNGGNLDFVDHVHFFVPSDPFSNAVDGEHPLKIFTEVQHRDPQDLRPHIFDHDDPGSDTVLLHRQGAAPGGPYLMLPLGDDPGTPEDEGDVDLHVEIADDMNGGAGTTLVPTAVSYWIEGRNCDGNPPVVRDAGSPYTLLRWDDRFYLDEGVDWRHLVDEAQDLEPWIENDGTGYPNSWSNFKHFIVTNTSGSDGSPANVDESQYWNTDAMDDASPASVSHANFAGLPDAGRAADARFPDGDYAVNVRMEDLIGASSEQVQDVQLENFPPAVRQSCAAGGAPDFARLRFSEPMNQGSVESALQLTVDGVGVIGFSTAWDTDGCTLDVTPDGSPEQVTWLLDAATATDLAGRTLDGAFDSPSHNGVSEGSGVDSVAGTFLLADLAEVGGLAVAEPSDGVAAISWPEVPGATGYAITRGLISGLGTDQYGPCLARGIETPTFDDAELPPTRDGYAYLVQGEAPLCGSLGTLGTTGSGERINANPDSCQ
jgi:hypothetical protein